MGIVNNSGMCVVHKVVYMGIVNKVAVVHKVCSATSGMCVVCTWV